MKNPAVTYNDVACAAATLVSRHEFPSIRSVHAHLGRGSFTTLARHLETWRKETPSGNPESPNRTISQDFRRILAQEISRHVRQSVAAKSEEVGRLARSLREALVENARLAYKIDEREKEAVRKEQRIMNLLKSLEEERTKTKDLGIQLREAEKELNGMTLRCETAEGKRGQQEKPGVVGSPGSSRKGRLKLPPSSGLPKPGRFMTIEE